MAQTGSFNSFLKSFEITLGEAGGTGWDSDRKIDALRPCLNDYLKRKLDQHDVLGTTPRLYSEFVALCKRYTEAGTTFTPTSGNAPNQNHIRLYDLKQDKMDVTVSTMHAIETPPSPRSSSSSSRSDPYRQSACHRCGSHEHYVVACPIERSPSPTRRTARSKTPDAAAARWQADRSLSPPPIPILPRENTKGYPEPPFQHARRHMNKYLSSQSASLPQPPQRRARVEPSVEPVVQSVEQECCWTFGDFTSSKKSQRHPQVVERSEVH